MLINFFMNGIHKDEKMLAFCGISAFFAGILNGFIGVGGGVLMLFILKLIYKNDKKAAFACIPAVVLPMTVLSAALYVIREPDIIIKALPLVPAALAGGFAGSLLLGKIKSRAVSVIFAVITLFAGIMAVVR